MTRTTAEKLHDLAERFWDMRLAAEPLSATLLGDHRFDTALPDRSEEAEVTQMDALRGLLADADDLSEDAVAGEDRITLQSLRFEAQSDLETLECALAEFAVSASMIGPQVELLETAPRLTLPEPEHTQALIARYRSADRFFATASERLRQGVAKGRVPTARTVHQAVEQIDAYLASPLLDDPLLTPAPPSEWTDAQKHAWREELAAAVTEVVRPALARYRDTLVTEVHPAARPPERSGLVWLPDGEQTYAKLTRAFTSVDTDPQRVHATGREAIARLADEYRELGEVVLGSTELQEIYRRLREDPGLRFETPAGVLSYAEAALRRAEAAMPDWFRRLPQTPCAVEEMGVHEVKTGTIAYYNPPAPDGTRPGTYVVNTYQPETRTRFEAEALAFHESVPGHHAQIAIAQELEGLPTFRRHATANAYIEGWALYTERLADEMGLYSGDLERLGMLSFDSWRAGRLVVDTGLHHLGWSREQAVAYLRDNSPLALNNIDNEVNRYIVWPGQALSYKTGQQEIMRLRREAEDALGAGFDIRGFHDAVLGHGAVPLAVLAEIINGWVATRHP